MNYENNCFILSKYTILYKKSFFNSAPDKKRAITKTKTLKIMTQFAVLHIDKNKGGHIGLSKHISRETIPANADP